MVSQGYENDNSVTSRTKTTKRPTDPSQQPHSTPPPTRSTTLVSVPLIRKQLNNTGVSAAAQEVIMASWRQGTLKQYKTFLAKWELFCRNNNISPSQATTEDGIEFLTSLFNSGLSYSALNTARSALSAVMKINDNISFGEHPLVCRFIKGVFQLKPALPKYTHIWDVEKVLSYLQTLAPVTSLDLKQLSLKLATLLAILTGQRCQTIHKLDLNLMQTLPDRYVFAIGEKLKHTRPGQHQEPIELVAYQDKRLCVVEAIKQYISVTDPLRDKSESKLLISFRKPHRAVSKDTVARWVKSTLANAGIDVTSFATHSTRAASTSYSVNKAGLSLAQVLKAAGWANGSTFAKFYNKLPQNDNYGNVILESYSRNETHNRLNSNP